MLTKYTKLNKSASVFLGGPPDKPRDDDNKTFSYVETGLNRRKEAETTLLRAHLRRYFLSGRRGRGGIKLSLAPSPHPKNARYGHV